MAINMYDKSKSSKPTTYIERLKMEAEQRKKKAVMDKAAAADKAAKAKAAAAEDKKRTEFNARKSGTLPKFAAAKEVARTVRNEAQAKAKAIRDESNARTKAESVAKFGPNMDKPVKAATKAAAKASSAAPAKSKINPLGRKLDKNGAPIVSKAELEKSGLSLGAFLNRERKLTPRDKPLQKLKEIDLMTGEQMSKGGMPRKKK
jgi:hypothetical protein